MQTAINRFRLNISGVKELDSIHTLLIDKFPLLTERADEILRAEIVMLVSAMDCYIHDIVRVSMIEMFKGSKSSNKYFDDFAISSKTVVNILNTNNPVDRVGLFENEIQEIISKDSYQSPSSIEYALRFLDIRNLWTVLSSDMEMRPDDIKSTLSLIIHRRNKIAHEADFNQVTLTKNPIDKMICDSNIEFISKFCEAINKYINNNGSQHMV